MSTTRLPLLRPSLHTLNYAHDADNFTSAMKKDSMNLFPKIQLLNEALQIETKVYFKLIITGLRYCTSKQGVRFLFSNDGCVPVTGTFYRKYRSECNLKSIHGSILQNCYNNCYSAFLILKTL